MLKKMSPTKRKTLQARVAKRVAAHGLVATAQEIGITYATLRRFLAGKDAHEGTLRQIAGAVPR